MKTVKWIGPDRLLFGYGEAKTGQEIKLPEQAAESYIDQGLAQPVKRKADKAEDKS
jgi:hypothetical protein